MAQDNFWLSQLPWMGTQGGPNGGGGSMSTVENVQYRDPLDAARSGALGRGRIGQADYPDGYLGPVSDRRQDRLQNEIAGRLTDRSYQRGVHAGVKMNRVQYMWPEELTPDQGIQRELAAKLGPDGQWYVKRQAPATPPVDHLVNGGKLSQLSMQAQDQVARRYGVNPADTREGDLVSPARAAQLARDLPNTSW